MTIKAILLCAGYGTRLAKDIEQSAEYAHLKGVPKPLLPIAGKPLISHWIEDKTFNDVVTDIVIVVNSANYEAFKRWADGVNVDREIKLIVDGSTSNATRLGAVACIDLAAKHLGGSFDGALVIAGDTLLPGDFDLATFVSDFEAGYTSLIVHTNCEEEQVSKRGIVQVDPKTSKVESFLEKPSPLETRSRLQSPAFYLLTPADLALTSSFLEEKRNSALEEKDATGKFIKFLVDFPKPIRSQFVSERFDVGSLDTYLECNRVFTK